MVGRQQEHDGTVEIRTTINNLNQWNRLGKDVAFQSNHHTIREDRGISFKLHDTRETGLKTVDYHRYEGR